MVCCAYVVIIKITVRIIRSVIVSAAGKRGSLIINKRKLTALIYAILNLTHRSENSFAALVRCK